MQNLFEQLGILKFLTEFQIKEDKYLFDQNDKKHKVEKYVNFTFKFDNTIFLKSINSIINLETLFNPIITFSIYLPEMQKNDLKVINRIFQYLINNLIINDFKFKKIFFIWEEKWYNILFSQLEDSNDTVIFLNSNLEEDVNNLQKWKFNLKKSLIKLFISKVIIDCNKNDITLFEWKQVFLPDLIYSSITINEVIQYLKKDYFIEQHEKTKLNGNFDNISNIKINLDAIDKFWNQTKNKSVNVFIGLPFKAKFDKIREKIKVVLHKVGYVPQILDEIEHNGLIDEILIDEMKKCKFGIFDISEKNPNVYFEVGYIKSMNKDVILISRKRTKVGFDLAHINIIFYNNENDLKEKLERRIRITNPPK